LSRVHALLASLALIAGGIAPVAGHVRISTKVTWDREIAPIVQARCVTCHRDGGRAPMSLATYEEARPWAKAIKEEVLTRRMPRWHVVRGYGDFVNDPSLSSFEIALLASWADGGAPASAKVSTPTKVLAEMTTRAPHVQPRTRTVSVHCSAATLPNGRLLALKPVLERGTSVRMTLVRPDGSEEPLIWLKDFDPAFPETYWLRSPVTVSRGMRMLADTGRCSVELTYAG
jgi:hypothetical protein